MCAASWVFAINEDELDEGAFGVVFPLGVPVLIIRKEGRIYALSNKCEHMGCPMDGGTLEGYAIKCPCHDWKYDIRTGEFLAAGEIKLKTYEWKVSEGKVFVMV
ncbi:MAG: hypothetical protein BMS9Abin23_0114 [Thermodesulfobacteriota bacterium]|nr:MAG: hypothetical protein BMS9Abin23_0114 [Thermodesulfobacteriota bacterium]